jgi:hypothetical protein
MFLFIDCWVGDFWVTLLKLGIRRRRSIEKPHQSNHYCTRDPAVYVKHTPLSAKDGQTCAVASPK